jgi:glycosyltransferase involved in cell wall biosynthesis
MDCDVFERAARAQPVPMKILFCSVPFSPSVGGIETVSAVLAEQFVRQGHGVTVVTQTPSDVPDREPYRVVRRPRAATLLGLVREADVVFHNNISLRMAWPLLLCPRPWVVAHHTWIPRTGLAGRVKRALLRLATNISVSQAVADDLPVPSTCVPNPYRASLFRPMEGVARTQDIVFVGRLVSEKGAPLLLEALHELKKHGLRMGATLVGSGPELTALQSEARRLGVLSQVHFAGLLQGEELVRVMHQHHALVVPSVCEETFGLVALEGLACGCQPIVARSGGLREAAGPCGRSFAKGDATALASELLSWHGQRSSNPTVLAESADHLDRHRPDRVAASYLEVLHHACQRRTAALAA